MCWQIISSGTVVRLGKLSLDASLSEEDSLSLWRFVRGDFSSKAFEDWLYSNTTIEQKLPEELYFSLISVNYSDQGERYVLKQKLRSYLLTLTRNSCQCITLSDLGGVGMGEHEQVFQTLNEVHKYGMPLWWLWLARCSNCEQFWLVASEERINDVFLMRRITLKDAKAVINSNNWPDHFKTFHELLSIGKKMGIRWSFIEYLSPALIYSVKDIAIEKPGITVGEIAELLQVDLNRANALVTEALKNYDIIISLT